MKKLAMAALAILAASGLAGCATFKNKVYSGACSHQGFVVGTAEHAGCVERVAAEDREASRQLRQDLLLGALVVGAASAAHSPAPIYAPSAPPTTATVAQTPMVPFSGPRYSICADGSFVSGASCRMAPNGSFVGGQPKMAPDGSFVAGRPVMAPDGSFVGSNSGRTKMCPDGSFVGGTRCVMTPDGSFVGAE